MILTFSSNIESSDTERRIIAGKIAPYGEIGNTSAGAVVFQEGSISIPDVEKIKLLMSHDNTKPIGRMQSMKSDKSGVYASFKISASTKGSDAILLAQENLMSGLSVGVEVTASKPQKTISWSRRQFYVRLAWSNRPLSRRPLCKKLLLAKAKQ